MNLNTQYPSCLGRQGQQSTLKKERTKERGLKSQAKKKQNRKWVTKGQKNKLCSKSHTIMGKWVLVMVLTSMGTDINQCWAVLSFFFFFWEPPNFNSYIGLRESDQYIYIYKLGLVRTDQGIRIFNYSAGSPTYQFFKLQ